MGSWSGSCANWNWSVQNNCTQTYNVRIDIPNKADTSCKVLRPGERKTFTAGCGDAPLGHERGVVKC